MREERKSLTYSKPLLQAPIDDAIVADNPPHLSWAALPGVSGYIVQWSQDPTFGAAPEEVEVPGTSVALPSALAAGRWYWWVQARSTAGTALYSQGSFQVAAGPVSSQAGDLNEDGVTGTKDALITLRIAISLQEPTAVQLALGDVNHDGKITLKDAILVLRLAVGL